jgi:superfamily II DNA or RNA helicase
MFITDGTITHIRKIKKPKYVYDLTTKNHNYFANGVLVHNSDLLIEAAHAKRLIDITASELIDRGYLVQPITYLYQFKHERKNREEPYPEIYDTEVVNNVERNKVIVSSALKATSQGKTVLIAVTKIEHGQILETIERQTVLKELNARKRKIVICTTIFGEGIDIPTLDVLINAKASASSIDAFQLIGRVLRKTEYKTRAYVVDIFDQSCKYLSQHSKERLRIYQTEPKYILKQVSDVTQLNFDDEVAHV